MAKRSLEKLADKIIQLTPEEGQQLGLIIRAKLLPEMAKKQAGLLEQAANNPKMAQMGQRPGGNMPMPNSRQAAMQGLLRQGDRKVNMPKVGKKKFAYTKAGKKKAKAYAKKKKKKVRY